MMPTKYWLWNWDSYYGLDGEVKIFDTLAEVREYIYVENDDWCTGIGIADYMLYVVRDNLPQQKHIINNLADLDNLIVEYMRNDN